MLGVKQRSPATPSGASFRKSTLGGYLQKLLAFINRVERSARPYSPCDVDIAEICDIRGHGISEGEVIAEAVSEI
jgi:hypothetical protein